MQTHVKTGFDELVLTICNEGTVQSHRNAKLLTPRRLCKTSRRTQVLLGRGLRRHKTEREDITSRAWEGRAKIQDGARGRHVLMWWGLRRHKTKREDVTCLWGGACEDTRRSERTSRAWEGRARANRGCGGMQVGQQDLVKGYGRGYIELRVFIGRIGFTCPNR